MPWNKDPGEPEPIEDFMVHVTLNVLNVFFFWIFGGPFFEVHGGMQSAREGPRPPFLGKDIWRPAKEAAMCCGSIFFGALKIFVDFPIKFHGGYTPWN